MKEKYVKPEVELIELELTEAIASSCGTSAYNQGQYSCQLKPEFGLFDSPFTAENSCQDIIQGYCYYTSASTIFAS